MIAPIETSTLSDQLGVLVCPGDDNKSLLMPSGDQFLDAFKTRGLVLFRGFDLNKESFVHFTEAVSPGFMDYSGGAYPRERIDGNETVLSVTGNRQFFSVPFHGEMFYTQFRPAVLWFYCVSPSASDGETTFCDGISVLEQLPERTRRLFEENEVKYIRHYESDNWHGIYSTTDPEEVAETCAARNTIFTHFSDDNSISIEFQCSALSKPHYVDQLAFINNILPVIRQEASGSRHSLVRLADGSEIPKQAVEDIYTVTDKLALNIAWQAQDLVMVDNSRAMHGRRAFNDTGRELNVRMSSTVY